jgi:natural product biosynthesis luciferase-like monooxygenase protein
MDFSLFFFANHQGQDDQKYSLITEASRWADTHNFVAVWLPERHFHAFGGLSPNPSVLAAALATITDNVQLRSGSVVTPLHDPIRIVEEWSTVDNLSNGRAGMGVACGWVPNDFVISGNQAAFASRKDVFARSIDTIGKLWSGESIRVTNPHGEAVDIVTLPRPIQPKAPLWITAAVNPETFEQAGRLGINVLTHLLGQSIEVLGDKVAIYRQAWETAGHPGQGTVTLMLHAFVGDSDEEVYDLVREPMKRYLGSSLDLAIAHPESVPFLPGAEDVEAELFTDETVDQMLEASFERYFFDSSLLGTTEACLEMVEIAKQNDVDEIACLIDFGLQSADILPGLEKLNQVRELANTA